MAYDKEALNCFNNNFAEGFIEKCSQCVEQSNEDRLKNNDEDKTSLLKFSEWDPIHDVVRDKINTAVDSIAIDRELELENEETLIVKKKEELKKWFINNNSRQPSSFKRMNEAAFATFSFQRLTPRVRERPGKFCLPTREGDASRTATDALSAGSLKN